MQDPLEAFRRRLRDEWLPSFCDAPGRRLSGDGFREESIDRLSALDALWFMSAVDSRLVNHVDGCFLAARSKAKEQIFWEGARAVDPRPLTLWLEPVITIGALGRLHLAYGWPADCLGAQPGDRWAFDLACYSRTADREIVLCEVKKSRREVDDLVRRMTAFAAIAPLEEVPTEKAAQNAYRKVASLRRRWPSMLWIVGPDGDERTFHLSRDGTSLRFELAPAKPDAIRYSNNRTG